MRYRLSAAALALPLAVAGGFVYAHVTRSSYICPITGENLPCPNCCPLNGGKASGATLAVNRCDDPTCQPDCGTNCPPCPWCP